MTTKLSIDLPESDCIRFKFSCNAAKATIHDEIKELVQSNTENM